MTSLKRPKRDTVENLYRQCQLGADCPPDVRNKVEATTLADKLLQAFGSIIFLGGLGIGSGRGSGSITTGRAVPDLAPEATPIRPTRPRGPNTTRPFSVPIDRISVGSSGGRAVTVDATTSSVIPLSEAAPDTVITLGDPNINVTTDVTVAVNPIELESLAPTSDVPAIINVTPIEPPPVRVIYSDSPAFTNTQTLNTAYVDPDINVFVDPTLSGEHIGYEDIELNVLGGREEFEIEETTPTTSTPLNRLQTAYNNARQFYLRRVQQVPTRNINFLGQPSRAVVFDFENPAFENDITLEFEQDLAEVAAAPDEDFRDIRRLSRPTFSITNEGILRMSRLGTRGTMQTRAGTVLGGNVHFYYDFTAIPEAGEIELQDLVPPGVPHTIVNPQAESSFINALADTAVVSEEELIDLYNESFDNAQLIIEGITEENERLTFPIPLSLNINKPFIPDVGDGIFYSSPSNTTNNINQTIFPSVPFTPGIIVGSNSTDYDLHPSLRKRKKRRLDYDF
uniref:Minor capsid protein L2 n=1 Tax=Human papillomavirus TaxID=10566 RepID=H2BQA5_9PAPI|nr:L2 protein [Human papillomavirus]